MQLLLVWHVFKVWFTFLWRLRRPPHADMNTVHPAEVNSGWRGNYSYWIFHWHVSLRFPGRGLKRVSYASLTPETWYMTPKQACTTPDVSWTRTYLLCHVRCCYKHVASGVVSTRFTVKQRERINGNRPQANRIANGMWNEGSIITLNKCYSAQVKIL